MKAQASDGERESIANSIIVNDKDESSLLKQVESIWSKLQNLNGSIQ
jgi:dephospho-CoA kinase